MSVGAQPSGVGGASRARSLTDRVIRSSLITIGGFALSQGMRLGTNLILTRILFPEAFGLMALVSVFLVGLAMFSDVGIGPAIMQSERGDERDFLDTAWTIQMIRGTGLWLVAGALAWPVAMFFSEPLLIWLLPVAALTQLINGFMPTRLETANRHLLAGRVTLAELASQLIGVLVAVLLAWWMQSVWALVISGIVSALAHVLLVGWLLPGARNRLRWERAAVAELIRFGKWIFLSTIAGFLISQSDKVILGRFLSLDQFGVYNIGFFLASFPILLGGAVTRRVLIPAYRESPPARSRSNFLRLRRMRIGATLALILLLGGMGLSGVWLIEWMYDARYQGAGAVVVMIACAKMPLAIVLTYDQAALAVGESRRFFMLTAVRALLMIAGMLSGVLLHGLFGALAGLGMAVILAYPAVVWLARGLEVWDPLHDAIFAALGLLLAALAIWWNRAALVALFMAG